MALAISHRETTTLGSSYQAVKTNISSLVTPSMNSCLIGFDGFFTGYQFVQAKSSEDYWQKNKNPIFIPFYQHRQINHVCNLIEKINQFTISPWIHASIQTIASVTSWIALPSLLFASAIKNYGYEATKEKIPTDRFPKKLSQPTIQAIKCVADYTGEVARVSMIAGTIFLLTRGDRVYGTMVLTAFTYDTLDRHDLLPKKVRDLSKIIYPSFLI